MTTTMPPAAARSIERQEAHSLAATENARVHELLASLAEDEWGKPTDCAGWDVRDLAAHVLGSAEGFSSYGQLVRLVRAVKKAAEEDTSELADAMTAVQVLERADLSREALLGRLATAVPRSARFRARIPAPLRAIPMERELRSGEVETWSLGYLLDTILTRDTWMHRVDIARSAGRELVLTAEHDGRIVADAVAEWARRHGRPFILELTGPVGGTFTQGVDGESITIDAVELCWILSGHGRGCGLLAQEVPF